MIRESDAGKWFILGFAGLLVTGCSSTTELCLLLFGREGRAHVVKTYESRSRRTTRLTIEYEFTDDDGRRRHEDCTVARRTPVAGAGSTIAIRYSNGPFRTSRLSAHPNWIGLAFSVAALGSIAFGVFVLIRQRSAEPERDRERNAWRRDRAKRKSPEPPEWE
jgi:hypothetical protein